jgi:hypothetical protein
LIRLSPSLERTVTGTWYVTHRLWYNRWVPILLEAMRLPIVGDVPLLKSELWSLDIQRLAILDGSVFLYLRLGEQSRDSTVAMCRELVRDV